MRIYLLITCTLLGLSSICGQSTFEQAQELTKQHSFESSSAVLVDYIDQHPQRKYDIARAWWLHSYNLLQQNLIEEALLANTNSLNLRKALRSTDAAYNYLRQAEIYLANSNYDAALDASLQGMQLMIEDAVLYAELNMMSARILMATENYEEGQIYLQTALDIIAIELGKEHILYSRFTYKAGFLALKSNLPNKSRQYFSQAYIHSDNLILAAKAFFFAVAKY